MQKWLDNTGQLESFDATLGAKNGVPAQKYKFELMELTSTSGNVKDQMISQCSALGMKPVCEHPSYCKNDARALYIGQDHHMSHPSHYNNPAYMPSGFDTMKSKVKGLCWLVDCTTWWAESAVQHPSELTSMAVASIESGGQQVHVRQGGRHSGREALHHR